MELVCFILQDMGQKLRKRNEDQNHFECREELNNTIKILESYLCDAIHTNNTTGS